MGDPINNPGTISKWKDIWSYIDTSSTARVIGYVTLAAGAFKAMDLYKTWALEEKARQNLYDAQTQTTALVMKLGVVSNLITIGAAALGAIGFGTATIAVVATTTLVVSAVALGGVVNRRLIPNNYGAMGNQTGKVLGLF